MSPYQMLAYFRRSAYGMFLKGYVQAKMDEQIKKLENEAATVATQAKVQAYQDVFKVIFEAPYSE